MRKIYTVTFSLCLASCANIMSTPSENLVITAQGNKLTFETTNYGSFNYQCKMPQPIREKHARTELFIYGDSKNEHSSPSKLSYANFHTVDGKELKISKSETIFSFSNMDAVIIDWDGQEQNSVSKRIKLNIDNSRVVKQFVDKCEHAYSETKVLITLSEKAKPLKGISIGGKLDFEDVAIFSRYSNPERYRKLLKSEKTAYYLLFGSYVVSQQLAKDKYILRHITDYYNQNAVNGIPIILQTSKQLIEGDNIENMYVVSKGITMLSYTFGANRQAIQFDEL